MFEVHSDEASEQISQIDTTNLRSRISLKLDFAITNAFHDPSFTQWKT